MACHIVQASEWGEFKTAYGTTAFRVGGVQYTLHKIPFTEFNFAYAPKVSVENINFAELKKSLQAQNCIALNFDVPNVLKGSDEEKIALALFKDCIKSPRDQFAKFNVLLDTTQTEAELLEKMHHKHRYNLKYAEKKGVTVKEAENAKDFDTFFDLYAATAVRQKYYIHPKRYYQTIWEKLYPNGIAKILTAYYENEPLASWLFFVYDNVLYYPYGGSSEKFRNLNASTLVAWEGIKLGKKNNCKTFDMWGASKNPNDTTDPWYGFTNFKLKFGGTYVEYTDSYDFVLNKVAYDLFNTANSLRWTLLKLIK